MNTPENTSQTQFWKRNLFFLWSSQVLVNAGFCACMPFIPLFIRENFGITDDGRRGFIVAMFYFFGMLAYVISNPVWGMLSDRFGVKPMLLRGTFVTALIYPWMGYCSSAAWLIALRFLSAACAGTTAASNTMIVKTTPSEKQGFALGTLSTGFWGGAMIGNVIGGLSSYLYGYRFTFVLCAVLYFIAGLLVCFTKDAPCTRNAAAAPAKIKKNPWMHLQIFTGEVWLLLLMFTAYGFVRKFEEPYVSMLIERITGTDTASFWTGIVSAFVAIGAIGSGMILGGLSDRVDPKRILLPTLVLSAAMLVLQATAERLWIFALARTMMYFAMGGLLPVMQRILSLSTPRRKRGKVFGFSDTASNFGVMLSSLAGGWLIGMVGTRGIFWMAGCSVLCFLPVAWGVIACVIRRPLYLAQRSGRAR
ncbi:MAG: MFS transporter [Victivallaceae bacterium]|nr:MFS transporter [Victivallaceae bacterium]